MKGLYFDFENADVGLNPNGSFATSKIDSQNCAMIALYQICRLTAPHVGEQIASKVQNRKQRNVTPVLASAKRAVERDGGKRVSITIDADQQLQFMADYGND